MNNPRVSGILLHPTSLPGPGGVGGLGEAAHRFVDFLVTAGQSRWQVLPLGPTGFGDSPYACLSTFAGNPLLICPERLVADGLLDPSALADAPAEHPGRVDYGAVIPYRHRLLATAFERFSVAPRDGMAKAFAAFCTREGWWLDDYALFTAVKAHHGGAPWHQWEAPIRDRAPDAIESWSERLADELERVRFEQFLFDDQWVRLRSHANGKGVRIIGDLPIFVPLDSADTWVSPELFHLDESGYPTVVAGVPPDYFSATGQLWGNPLYRWEAHAESGYAWWIQRIRAQLERVDILRLDHFRGFAAYWEVPAESPVASAGRWIPGPGMDLFRAVGDALGNIGHLPLIAEDLGVITEDVVSLREGLGLPGMAVLQFAFDSDAENPHMPHRHQRNQVVYTGTHDNDTTLGWFTHLDEKPKAHCLSYLGDAAMDMPETLVRVALASVADTCILPLQDLLELGSEARMNRPGHAGGNWSWRTREGMFDAQLAETAFRLARLYGRA